MKASLILTICCDSPASCLLHTCLYWPVRGQVSLQSAVLLHPPTLVTGIPQSLTPGAGSLKLTRCYWSICWHQGSDWSEYWYQVRLTLVTEVIMARGSLTRWTILTSVSSIQGSSPGLRRRIVLMTLGLDLPHIRPRWDRFIRQLTTFSHEKGFCAHFSDGVEAVLIEWLQQWPGAVKYPHDPLPHQAGLTRISVNHVLYGLALMSRHLG